MSQIYNALINVAKGAVCIGNMFTRQSPTESKLRLFMRGQKRWRKELAQGLPPADGRPTYWFHAASLGEFGVIRPIIKRISAQVGARVILTFFSSTGYEALKPRTDLTEIDYVGYLPLDTPGNVTAFLDLVKPDCAVFAISEYWINYLHELKHRGIPTYLLSALITSHAPFFKWWGKPYREILDCYTSIMVLTDDSRRMLEKLGCRNVVLTGDPLFDNAQVAASAPWRDETIEAFAPGGQPVFIAGSISDRTDFELCMSVARNHPGLKCIFVPHEITPDDLAPFKKSLGEKCIFRSECTPDTDFHDKQVMIIDSIGYLAYIYRYGTMAYIGGGFTPRLHSIIEATIYGIPTAFGPQIHRKATAQELIRLGIGTIVRTSDQLNQWLDNIINNKVILSELRKTAISYAASNCGATDKIVSLLSTYKPT